MTAVGRKCTILHHKERSCDVAPFSDTCDSMKDVDIVSESTGFTSVTRQQYILVFHYALYFPELDHTLINPNQLRQLQTQVQDNTYHAIEPMNITNPSGNFTACLEYQGEIYIPQHLVSNSDRPICIPTYRFDFKTTM